MASNFSMMASNGVFLKDEDEFVRWFWEGTDGNNLIKKLNNMSPGGDRIRREKHPPHIYGVVVNDDNLRIPFQGEQDEQWKLCKIGFTQCTTAEGENNRMEQVENEVKKTRHDASTLFVLRIGAVDTSKYHETETRKRGRVGKRLCKEKAKKLKLPYPTEWVLTTQKHINDIKKKKTKAVKEKKEGDVIDFFKDIKVTPSPPAKYKGKWFE